MADREKVIKALECCYCNFPKQMDCNNCPYDKICYHDKACSLMLRDALALLEEQQQQIWEFQDQVEYLTDKLKNRAEEIERLKTPTAGGNQIPLRW